MATKGWLTRTALTLGLAGGIFVAFMASQGAVLTVTELRKIGASAHSPAQHHRLAAHYHMRAAELNADAAAHEAIAKTAGERTSNDDLWDLARDATHYAEHTREAAKAAMDLADLHEAMATRSGER